MPLVEIIASRAVRQSVWTGSSPDAVSVSRGVGGWITTEQLEVGCYPSGWVCCNVATNAAKSSKT